MLFEKEIDELRKRKALSLEMGGREKAEKRHAKGKYSVRERIAKILDPGSFFEVGLLNQSDEPGMADKTPADGKVAGYGTVDSRRVAIIANDFTVLASTSSRVAMAKERELKSKSASHGYPVIDFFFKKHLYFSCTFAQNIQRRVSSIIKNCFLNF